MSEMRYSTFSALEKLKKQLWTEYDHDKAVLIVCVWDGDQAADAVSIFIALEEIASQKNVDVRVELQEIDSRDIEDQGPLVMALPSYILHTHVQATDAPEILDEVVLSFQEKADFFPGTPEKGANPFPAERLSDDQNPPVMGIEKELRTEQKDIKPTVSNILLGAYVLASRKAAQLLGTKETKPGEPKEKSIVRMTLEQTQERVLRKYDASQPTIVICAWRGKCATDAIALYQELKQNLEQYNSNASVHIKKINPKGFEDQGPLVFTLPVRALYVKVRKYDAEPIVKRTILNGEILEGLLYREAIQEEPRTLSLDELTALASEKSVSNRYLDNLQKEYAIKELNLPETLPLLRPDTLAFVKPDEIKKFSLDSLNGLRPGTAAAILDAAAVYQDAVRSVKPIKGALVDPAENSNGEQAFLTVSELMKLAVDPDDGLGEAGTEAELPSLSQLFSEDKVQAAFSEIKEKFRSATLRNEPEICILLGDGTVLVEAEALREALQDALQEIGFRTRISISPVRCHYSDGLSIILYPAAVLYVHVKTADAESIIRKTFRKGQVLTNLLYRDSDHENVTILEKSIPFNQQQVRILTANANRMQDGSLSEALANHGYDALSLALSTPQEMLIDEIRDANLRSRRGIGEPVWQKLDTCRKQQQTQKNLISIIHSGLQTVSTDATFAATIPHRMLEGMVISAYAAGIDKGLIYIHSKHEKALERIQTAVREAYENHLLGSNILNSGFNFDIEIVSSAEPAVGAEPTAILNLINGLPPEPFSTPPYPDGIKSRNNLTIVDCACTWGLIPQIILYGAREFAESGSKSSGGSFLISIQGDEIQPVIVEVPAGMKIRKILQTFAGADALKTAKAVQIGGIPGQILPLERLDGAYDFALRGHASNRLGSMLTVYGQRICLVQLALQALEQSAAQACGQCLSCRVGLNQLIRIMKAITEGKGTDKDLTRLTELAFAIRDSAMCSFGYEAVVPLLSTIKYFYPEFEAHLNGVCPAGKCSKLTDYLIYSEKCTGCGDCQPACPVNAIEGTERNPRDIDLFSCTRCGNCLNTCPHGAIYYE